MTPSEPKQQKVQGDTTATATPAAGSTLYYSLLYCSKVAQQRSVKTLKLVNTLSTTLYDVNEPQVAEKKIHWWHEELSRLANQNARHPDCIAVQDFVHNQASLKACLSILSAAASERYNPLSAELDLREQVISDYRARIALFEHALKTDAPSSELPFNGSKDASKHGSKGASIAAASQPAQPITFQPSPGTTNPANLKQDLNGRKSLNARDAMALGLGYCHRLNSLATRIQNGYPVFSDELYQRFNMTPENIIGDGDAQAILDHVITQAKDALSDSIELFSGQKSKQITDRPSIPLSLLIMCQIRHAQMHLWQKKHPNLIRESIALTPVRKFFIAYRCKRQHRAQV